MKVLTQTTICDKVLGEYLVEGDSIVKFTTDSIFLIVNEDGRLLARSYHISGGRLTFPIYDKKEYWKAIESNNCYYSGGSYIKTIET